MVLHGQIADGRTGPHVEADDHGSRVARQQHVRFADRTHGLVHHPDLHLFGVQFHELVGQSFHGAGHVALDDYRQFLQVAGGHQLGQVVQVDDLLGPDQLLLALEAAPLGCQFPRLAFALQHVETISGLRNVVGAENLAGLARLDLRQGLPALAQNGAHLAVGHAHQESVPHLEGPLVDKNGEHHAAARLLLGLDHGPAGGALGTGLQFQHLGLQVNHVQKMIDADALLRGDGRAKILPAEFLDGDAVLQQFLLDPIGLGIGQIDLVHRHDQGHSGGLGMADRFHRLGHDTVIGRHDENHDVGDLGATGAHGRERRMARRVEEGDRTASGLNRIGADVLGDPAGLARDHVGLANVVEQRGLAVIHMAHDGDHRRPVGQILILDLALFQDLLAVLADELQLTLVLRHQHLDLVFFQALVDGDHQAHTKELADQFLATDHQFVRQFLHGDELRELEHRGIHRGIFLRRPALLVLLLAASAA